MMKLVFFLLVPLSYSFHADAQNARVQSLTNKFDSSGNKIGFWSEPSGDFKTERYYLHGVKNGIEKTYYRNGTLMTLLHYKMGHTIDVGYFFDEKGYLNYTIQYLNWEMYKGKKLRKGFFTMYDIDGTKKISGIGLFKEGEEELGEEIRIGKWNAS